MDVNALRDRLPTSLLKQNLIKSSCLIRPALYFDSGARGTILERALRSGTRIHLTAITGAKTTEAETVDAVFPVIAGSRDAILIRGKNIVSTLATHNILSLAVLLKESDTTSTSALALMS